MAKKFVFGETKVAKTSEEIREHSESKTEAAPTYDTPVTDNPVADTPVADTPATENTSATSQSEDENKQDENTSVTETVNTQQEDSESSVPLESKEQKTEAADKPVAATRERRRKNNTADRFALKGVKTENGIVVNVPMDDYMQLMMLKIQTGRTLKDLALQAIHEFVERNKM